MLKKCHQYSKQATDEFREATETQEYCTKQLKAQEAKESVAVDRLKELEAMLMEQKQEVRYPLIPPPHAPTARFLTLRTG